MFKILGKRPSCIGAALIALAVTTTRARESSPLPNRLLPEYAAAAVADLTNKYWVGSLQSGSLEARRKDGKPVDLWGKAQAANIYYAWWKITGDSGAKNRFRAEWQSDAGKYADTKVYAACGQLPDANGTQNFAQDDTAWNANFYLQAFDVSGDSEALKRAKASLDCAQARWWDTANGGYWYSDKKSEKSSYQSQLIYALLECYRLSGERHYLNAAVAADKWVGAHLQRDDGLYWEGVRPDGTPIGADNPLNIKQASSVTFLAGNMAMAVVCARLYAITRQKHYLDRAQRTSEGILAHEVDLSGVLLDDRDAFVNGWAAVLFVSQVIPALPQNLASRWRKTLIQTGMAIVQKSRLPDGTYAGCWDGPADKSCVWTANGQSGPESMMVSANAIMMVLAAEAANRT